MAELELLNAYSVKRLDELDFDRRLYAFTSLNENLHQTMSPSNWLPVLYSMLYLIQDASELANTCLLCHEAFHRDLQLDSRLNMIRYS